MLFWHERERPRAGLWAVLAVFVKPIMGVLFIDLLARRQWRGLSVAAGGALALGAATLSVFGAPVFMSYLFDNPTLRVAPRLYMQPVNQSLIATLICASGHDFSAALALANPIFLVTGGLLSLVSFGVLLTLREAHRHWYRHSHSLRAPALAVPLLEHEEWDDQENAVMMERLRIDEEPEPFAGLDVIAAVFILMEYSAFSANLLVWAAVIGACLWQDRLALELTATKRARVA
jgi:glycosyl transferase family 87